MPDSITITDAHPQHAGEIAEIYNQGIAARNATFETEPRSAKDITSWFTGDIAVKISTVNGSITGFAKVSDYRDRACYSGIKEFSVYVSENFQRRGIAKQLMLALIDDCRSKGVWKLISRIFPENLASIELAKNLGFRVVGTYRKHGKLDGVWKDCVIVELSL